MSKIYCAGRAIGKRSFDSYPITLDGTIDNDGYFSGHANFHGPTEYMGWPEFKAGVPFEVWYSDDSFISVEIPLMITLQDKEGNATGFRKGSRAQFGRHTEPPLPLPAWAARLPVEEIVSSAKTSLGSSLTKTSLYSTISSHPCKPWWDHHPLSQKVVAGWIIVVTTPIISYTGWLFRESIHRFFIYLWHIPSWPFN